MLIFVTNIIRLKICGLIPKWSIALCNCIGIICTQKHKPDNENEYSKLMEVFERESFPRICKSCSWKRHDVPGSVCQCWAVLQGYTPPARALGMQGCLKWPHCSGRALTKHPWCLYHQVPCHKGTWKWQHSLRPGSGINVTIYFVSLCCLWAGPPCCQHTAFLTGLCCTNSWSPPWPLRMWCLSHTLLFLSSLDGATLTAQHTRPPEDYWFLSESLVVAFPIFPPYSQ